jgi:hypothetical protein
MKQKNWIAVAVSLLFFIGTEAAAQLPAPVFENKPTELSESGYIKLSWKLNGADAPANNFTFELQRSAHQDFEQSIPIYQGPDYASFISGLPDGDYYYRARVIAKDGTQTSDWSAPVLVQVKHHSLSLALLLCGIGAAVFLITVGIVVQGVRTSAHDI